jgi:hypothetical protein
MTSERDPSLAALVERERASHVEDAEAARATWSRIEATVAARATAAPTHGMLRFALLAIVIAAFVGGAYLLLAKPPRTAPATRRVPPREEPVARSVTPQVTPTDAGAVLDAEPAVTVQAAPRETREPTPSPLAEEVRLLEAARRRLAAGDREGVLRYVERHATRFPEGVLARERERLRERARNMEEAPR